MNQFVKIRQVFSYRVDAAASVEQVEIRQESEIERNALDLLGITITEVDKSRDVMSDIRDANGYLVGFVA